MLGVNEIAIWLFSIMGGAPLAGSFWMFAVFVGCWGVVMVLPIIIDPLIKFSKPVGFFALTVTMIGGLFYGTAIPLAQIQMLEDCNTVVMDLTNELIDAPVTTTVTFCSTTQNFYEPKGSAEVTWITMK